MAGAAVLVSQRALAAEEPTAYQEQFERWSQTIGELSRHGQASQTGSEIELMRTWLGQGQALLANERLKEIDPLLERIAALAEFVEAG